MTLATFPGSRQPGDSCAYLRDVKAYPGVARSGEGLPAEPRAAADVEEQVWAAVVPSASSSSARCASFACTAIMRDDVVYLRASASL